MKSDSSRNTFDPRKHFSSVRMQQGRVQVDADSNEQIDIVNHHLETETIDVIGECGAPIHYGAFEIVTDKTQLSSDEQKSPDNKSLLATFAAPDFLIGPGRYYVDGILCENDKLTSYLNQPDLPGAAAINGKDVWCVVYVDVWRRLVTAIDDPSIREVALGGPDTATRARTIWQIKYLPIKGPANCASDIADYTNLTAPSNALMSARTKPAQTPQNPCIVPPGAGYTGLENQFYRIEIHDGGDPFNVKSGGAGFLATRVPNHTDQINLGGNWLKGQAIEIFSNKGGDDPMNGTLAYITADPVTKNNKSTLTLDIDVSQLAIDELRVRTIKSTFKWSRDNGTIVTSILNISGNDVMVHDLGRDDILGFKPGQWVEISDDQLELNGLPGQLAQITFVDTAINKISLNATPTLSVNPDRHPKLRRWDGIGAVKFHPDNPSDHFLDLESGIQIRFFDGKYATGDYWNFPARTATADTQSGNIEWPTSGNDAVAQSPFGIKHHYCRLAILHWNGTKFDVVQDCRNLFPPLTELTNMFYEGGDGQEAMPGQPLPQPLQVAVFNGRWPVANASVKFSVSSAAGVFAPKADPTKLDKGHLSISGPPTLADLQTVTATTGADGIASCYWLLDSEFDSINQRFTKPSQQVEARLLDADGKVTPATVRFDGNLSIAEQVAYNHPSKCPPFDQDKTVQKAIDRLGHLISLYEVSGNNQQVVPGETLKDLVVRAANRCGPVEGQQVQFEVLSPQGNVNGASSVTILTDKDGLAKCTWKPGPLSSNEKPTADDIYQEVRATLLPLDAPLLNTQPSAVDFTCTLNVASRVFYEPAKCLALNGSNVSTVQDAIDHLCAAHQGGGCDVTVGKGGQFENLDQAIKTLSETKQDDICICLLAGDHTQPPELVIKGKQRVKIVGCGRGTRLRFATGGQSTFAAIGLTSFILRDVEVLGDNLRINISECQTVALENCFLTQTNQTVPFINIERATSIRFVANVVDARLPVAPGGAAGPLASQVFANVTDVPPLFSLSDTEFQSRSLATAAKLAGQPQPARASMATQVQSASKALGISVNEAQAVQGFVRAMMDSTADPAAIQATLANVRSAFQTPGVALVIADAEADTWLENNNINGIVALYGVPGQDNFTVAQLSRISSALKTSSLEFAQSQSQLQLSHNSLYRLSISGDLSDSLRKVTPSVKKSLTGLYRRSFISDNQFLGGNNIFLMEHMALQSNTFDKEGQANAGNVIVRDGIYVGNFGPNEIQLFNAAVANQKAANLIINIVDV
jgi:hypothetical protein